MGPIKFIGNMFDQTTSVINEVSNSAVNLAKAGSNFSSLAVMESEIAIASLDATKDTRIEIARAQAKADLAKVAKELGLKL